LALHLYARSAPWLGDSNAGSASATGLDEDLPEARSCARIYRLLVELLLLSAPDDHELFESFPLFLIVFLSLEFELGLLFLLDVHSTLLCC